MSSGSCGIIALSVIESFIDPNIAPWCPRLAQTIRLNWLQGLLLHHLAAIRSTAVDPPDTYGIDNSINDGPMPVKPGSPDTHSIPDETDPESDAGIRTPPRTSKFHATVPRSESGSPKKPKDAPLDPERPQTGMLFNTLEEAVHFVYEYERRRKYKWKKGESERNSQEVVKRLRLRCSSSSQRSCKHKKDIDPADFRCSKTKQSSCMARVNIRLLQNGMYSFASVNLTHFHPAVQDDHLPEFLPASQQQKDLVRALMPIKTLGRGDIHTFLSAQFPEHPLTLRQVSNLLDEARRMARNYVQDIGGDFVAIVEKLTELKDADQRWVFHVQTDEHTRRFQRLFWMSPTQVSLAQRFSDVIINDIAMLRNQYGLPLNIFVVVDHFFASRNIAYSLHTSETANEHQWALDCLFAMLPHCPNRVFFSDADTGLDLAVSMRPKSEISFHGRCLNHLHGNIIKRLAPTLGLLFQPFREAFWRVYYSISPAALEQSWAELLAKYPDARPYLENELWPDRERWAWAYVATRYTCGVRTSGRVEGENRVNKLIGDSKTSAYELFMNLVQRSDAQSDLEALRVRQTMRLRHPNQTEILFAQPLELLRMFCVPFAVQKSYDQMELSVFYSAELVPLPQGSDNWADFVASQKSYLSNVPVDEADQVITASEALLDGFLDDSIHISAQYLLQLITGGSKTCTTLFEVRHYATHAVHYVALLKTGHAICDCMMGTNLGIVCRHFYSTLRMIRSPALFHLGLFNKRWLIEPDFDIANTQVLRIGSNKLPNSSAMPLQIPTHLPSFHRCLSPLPTTRTLPPKVIHHQAITKFQDILRHVNTEAELKSLNSDIDIIISRHNAGNDAGTSILPPQPIRTKGRPRKKRLTSAIEGEQGGKRARFEKETGDGPGRRKCSKCGQHGHYATTCSKN